MPALIDIRTDADSLPVMAYLNRAADASFSSSGATTGFPAGAAKTYATYEGWRPSTGSGTLTAQFAVPYPVDYIGAVVIGAASGCEVLAQTSTDAISFDTVGAGVPGTDGTMLWLFDEVESCQAIRLQVNGGNTSGFRVAVLMGGVATKLQRGIYVGHTPINLGRDTLIASNRSENGQYLGRIIRRESLGTNVNLSNLTPGYYRQSLDPVFVAMKTQPAFWAWRPQPASIGDLEAITTETDEPLLTETGETITVESQSGVYASDVAYAWLQGNPSVVNQRPNGMMQASFELASGDFTL